MIGTILLGISALAAVWVGFGLTLHYYDTVTVAQKDAAPLRQYAWVAFREWLCHIVMIILYPLGFLPALGQPQPVPQATIVLVPGYLMTRSTMWFLAWRLKRQGFRHVVSVNIWPLLGPIEVLAQVLKHRVEALAQASGRPVYAVGHSQGGLLLRYIAQKDPRFPVARIVTVGTPHHGTRQSVFAPGENGGQMHPESEFIRALNHACLTSCANIYSTFDQIVLPPESAALGERDLVFDDLGHVSLLFDPRVIAAVARELGPARSAAAVHF